MARLLEGAAVLEVGRDAGAAEGVAAHLGGIAGGLGAPAHHLPGVGAVRSSAVQTASPNEASDPHSLPLFGATGREWTDLFDMRRWPAHRDWNHHATKAAAAR